MQQTQLGTDSSDASETGSDDELEQAQVERLVHVNGEHDNVFDTCQTAEHSGRDIGQIGGDSHQVQAVPGRVYRGDCRVLDSLIGVQGHPTGDGDSHGGCSLSGEA